MFHDNCDQHWPKLTSKTTAVIGSTDTSNTAAAATTTTTTTTDWEILEDDAVNTPIVPPLVPTTGTTTSVVMIQPNTNTTSSSGFVVVAGDNEEEIGLVDDHNDHLPPQATSATIVGHNYKHLRHSVSSPLLGSSSRRSCEEIVAELADAAPMSTTATTNGHDAELDDSFSVVSDVPSVWTTTTSVAKSTMTVSFRDAILLSSPNTEHTTNSYRTVAASAASSQQQHEQQQNTTSPRQRSRIPPKFVVSATTPTKQIRRCSKSTGDLLQLTISEEFDSVDNSSSTNSSSHDRTIHDNAEEYYHRKTIGATSRLNGLKLRPDEAQRREMILYKKGQQRLLNGGSKIKSNAATTTSKAR